MDVERGWMWREGGGCGGRVDVEGGWWMWREGGCTWGTLSTDISLCTGATLGNTHYSA